jgi:hypothetical protein
MPPETTTSLEDLLKMARNNESPRQTVIQGTDFGLIVVA